ncbi:hypothetical protein OB13_07305 [Pontibacter sp. HJ8]
MKAVIENKLSYDSLPSASGLEMLGDHYYVIGDDSPYLYRLDKNFKLESQEAMFDTAGFGSGRIPKPLKPDLEGMTLLQYKGEPYLLMLGSGSASTRRKAFLYNICGDSLCMEGAARKGAREIDMDPLFRQLEVPAVIGEGVLNIEGVASGQGQLYLLQRAIGTGRNVLISYALSDFIRYVSGEKGASLPQPSFNSFSLPVLDQLVAGFSGAYAFDNKLFFTASLEDTQDAISDGEVLGSFVGFVPFSELKGQIPLLPAARIVHPDGTSYTGKVESLVVRQRTGTDRYSIIVVTDDDKGGSELLELTLTLEE